jgi:hypothetical protein
MEFYFSFTLILIIPFACLRVTTTTTTTTSTTSLPVVDDCTGAGDVLKTKTFGGGKP